ncbi:hypothetical protein [Ktedonospora formicarum]|uniref:Lectin n=1 Tax=Ktedonospora formicarum TaxID=2778364 RepID=A0A8J3MVE7_9CHLR|nr:hypothetical protein [Ktedonospora formicarum]GHO50217.1 hypothetical protein KSX_83800 [Ktedonospora formicarum]
MTSFNDFAFEVKMSITTGDVGGVIFRTDGNYGYVLTIDTHGFSRLTLYATGSTQPKTLWEGKVSALKQGYGQVNTVGIVTQGSTISWYINSQRINSVSNSTFTSGGVGMIGGLYSNSTNKNSDVTFGSLRVWSL